MRPLDVDLHSMPGAALQTGHGTVQALIARPS
jgi:hypothetical protein